MTGGMMFKGTPGPWSTRLENSIYFIEAPDGDDSPWVVAEIMSNIGYEKDGAEENANLIAAAPELLEVLQLFVHEYVELVDSGDAGYWNAEDEAKVIKARAAIAKALGEKK